ncbi:MAG: serine hydrolase, partial [Candidatus Paceibacterales bacterium]
MVMPPKKFIIMFALVAFLVLIAIAVSFWCGWIIRDRFFPKPPYVPTILRLSHYTFTKPLLICDTKPERALPELKSLESNLNRFIKVQEAAKNVDTVSVYFQDFKTDGRIDINKDETFDPASLTKIPIMIAILKLSETSPDFLSKQIKYVGKDDFNIGQEIQPKEA